MRELHREWQRGLIEGELDRDAPVLPAGEMRQKRERIVTPPELEALLAAIPLGTNTRISLARSLCTDEWIDGGEVRRLVELGGFLVQGPITIDDVLVRYGPGEYRVTAYALEPSGLIWEVLCSIDSEAKTRNANSI